MTKRIYGGWDVTHNVTAQGKRTVQGINDEVFDANGNLDIDTYTKQEMLDIVGLLPLSHYGTHTYLPAGVSGSFDGASENMSYRRDKVFLEDDGTGVILRAGTNGSTEGVYYSYIQNALNTTNMNLSVNTNEPYRPGYFGSNLYAIGLTSTDDNIVVGYYKSRVDTSSGVFVSLMNGTLNASQHSGFLIPRTTVAPIGSLEYAMQIRDGSLLFFSLDRAAGDLRMAIVRVVYNESTGAVTTSQITGWTTKTFYNTTYSGLNYMQLIQTLKSTTVSDKPLILTANTAQNAEPFMTSIDLFAAQDPNSENIRIRFNGDAWAATGKYDTRPQHSFSFVLNINTKQCTLDAGNDIGSFAAPLVITDTGTALVVTGNIINKDTFMNHNGYRNIVTSYNYLSTGTVFSLSSPNLAEPLLLGRAHYAAQSIYSMLNVRAVSSLSQVYGIIRPTFGSAVGSYITGLEILPNNSTKQISTVTNGGISPSYSVHKATPNFTFNSLTFTTLQGYEPTTDRGIGENNVEHRAFISSISGNTVSTTGGIFMANYRYTQPASFDMHLTPSGVFSVTPEAINGFSVSEYALATSYSLSPTAFRGCALYVPQQTNIPAFAVLATVAANQQCYVKIVEVNVNARSGNISSITRSRVILEGLYGDANFRLDTGMSYDRASTGITIYDGGSFYFIGGSFPLSIGTVGNSNTPYFRGIVDKSSSQFSTITIPSFHPGYAVGAQPIALPGLGFGEAYQSDLGNKIVFYTCGTTIADYNAWTFKNEKPIVVVSQDVAQGFIVYFTEETPVMLSGKSFTLPITNIDLRTVKTNPANSTFYIYVKMNQGIAEYHITPEVISETGTTAYNVFWIGTVTTDSLQISKIDVFKRSRLDVFGASLEASGSSFPVSYGLPTNNGTINW